MSHLKNSSQSNQPQGAYRNALVFWFLLGAAAGAGADVLAVKIP